MGAGEEFSKLVTTLMGETMTSPNISHTFPDYIWEKLSFFLQKIHAWDTSDFKST